MWQQVKHAPCMSEGICTKKFPKAFHVEATLDENRYVVYRIRDNDKYSTTYLYNYT